MYHDILWELLALCAFCLLLGLIVGLYLSRWAMRRVKRPEAPMPDFDIYNPLNAQARKEISGGVEWTVYGGRRA